MENSIKTKLTFNSISDIITKFFYTEIPLAILSFFIIISWVFEIEILAFAIVILYASISLIFVDDTIPLMPCIILTTFTVADGINVVKYINFAYAAIIIVVALVFHMIKYKKPVKFGKMFFPQLFVAFALIIGGATTISLSHYLGTLALNLLSGIGILLMYFLFYLYRNKEKNIDTRKYFAKMLAYAGAIVSLQIFIYLMRSDKSITELANMFMDLGWGIDNNAATLLLISAPFTLYLATTHSSYKSIPYVLLGAIQYFAIVLTFSRGGVIFGILSAISTIIFLIKKSNNKKLVLLAGLLAIISALTIALMKLDSFVNMISGITFQGSGDNGRLLLYKEAILAFLNHPIFGVGLGYQGSNYEIRSISFYFFHSTFFQIIACTGLLGIFAYGYFYYSRYKIVIQNLKKSTFTIFALIGMLGFEGYSMIDTGTFVPFPCMMLMMFLTMILEESLPYTEGLNNDIITCIIKHKKQQPVDSL